MACCWFKPVSNSNMNTKSKTSINSKIHRRRTFIKNYLFVWNKKQLLCITFHKAFTFTDDSLHSIFQGEQINACPLHLKVLSKSLTRQPSFDTLRIKLPKKFKEKCLQVELNGDIFLFARWKYSSWHWKMYHSELLHTARCFEFIGLVLLAHIWVQTYVIP